ncbi:erythromycin esterase family protein [Hymenobacter rubidus]|nr:erythromycin esterase family protein [Hymenobacter rubidus]
MGFYGLDVYSLWESLQAVLHHAEQQGEGATTAARQAFRCFEPYSADP